MLNLWLIMGSCDSLFSKLQGILGTTTFVFHLLQVYPSFPAKAQVFFWIPEQAPRSDFRAIDLAPLAKPWEYEAGLVGLGRREALFLRETSGI